MSYRWFDFSRQIFWDNNNQDLSIPGTLRTSTAQISSLTTINISSLREQVGAFTTSSIGINCNTPSYMLDVNGPGRISTFIVGASNLPPVFSTNDHMFVNGFFDVYNTAQASTLIRMAGAFGTNYIQSGRASTASVFAPADLVFGSPGAVSEYVRFTSNGRVGINCNAPQNTLDVNGTTRLNGAVTMPNLSTNNVLITSGVQQILLSNTASTYMYMQAPGNRIRMGAFSNTSAMPFTINESGGNVGINCNAPQYQLDVNGQGRFVKDGESLRLQGVQDSNSLFTVFQKATLTAYIGWFGFGLQGTPYSNYFGMQAPANGNIAFYPGGAAAASPPLFLGSNSRVGILTNTPTTTLDVNGTTRLNGAVTMPSLPTNNVLITSAQQQILLSNAGVYMYMQSATNRIRIGAYSNIAVPFTINESGGDVGVGCNAPRYNLDLLGNMHISGQYFDDSDQRVKENIVSADTSICYSTMQGIDLKYFQWNSNFQSTSILRDRHQLGFLAQEIKQIFPNSVYISSNYGYDDFHGLEMKQINAMHYGATKKLMEIVEQQGSTIQGIQEQLSTLQKS